MSKQKEIPTHLIEWQRIKEFWYRHVVGDEEHGIKGFHSPYEWKNGDSDSWTGCSRAEMSTWLRDGYRQLGMEYPLTGAPTRERRRLKFWEEGEYDYDLDESGFDYPFLEWDKRPRRPGLAIRAEIGMNCGTSARVLADYGRWLAALCQGFEEQGYDLDLALTITLRGLHTTGKYKEKTLKVLIRVKRENEAMDYMDFSALFSPGGFRMLGFTAVALSAKDCNTGLAWGYGQCVSGQWDVDFTAERRTLTITCPSNASSEDAFTREGGGQEILDEKIGDLAGEL